MSLQGGYGLFEKGLSDCGRFLRTGKKANGTHFQEGQGGISG